MLDSEEETFSISEKVQEMVETYIKNKVQTEMKNYDEYKKVYEHILKLPMVSQNLENSVSKVNTYMTKKIVELTKEVSNLNKEIELLKQKLSFYENTEQNQNIHLEIKEQTENNKHFTNTNLLTSNIYNEINNTEENIVKKSNNSSLLISNNEIKIEESLIPELKDDIKSIEFVKYSDEEPNIIGDISPRCWSLNNSNQNLKGELDDEKANNTDLESETHEDMDACDEDEVEVEEMEIEGSIYYVTDKVDGIIYEMLPEEDIGDKLGEIKGGKAFFY